MGMAAGGALLSVEAVEKHIAGGRSVNSCGRPPRVGCAAPAAVDVRVLLSVPRLSMAVIQNTDRSESR